VSADAVEGDTRREVPEAPGLDRQVGRLEQHGQVGLPGERAAVEQGGERVVHRRQLLAAEEEQADVDRARLLAREVADELERDRDAALHVARAAPVHGARVDAARQVVLRRDGVVVPREQEERNVRTPLSRPEECIVPGEDRLERRRDECADVVPDRLLVEALRRDVDELERAPGEAVGEGAHRRPSLPAAGERHTSRDAGGAPRAHARAGARARTAARGPAARRGRRRRAR
jgi:hypothetical protein